MARVVVGGSMVGEVVWFVSVGGVSSGRPDEVGLLIQSIALLWGWMSWTELCFEWEDTASRSDIPTGGRSHSESDEHSSLRLILPRSIPESRSLAQRHR